MRICMFVANPISGDGRVLRHAQTLQDAGHEVTVLGVIGPADAPTPMPGWVGFRHVCLDRSRHGLLPRLFWAESATRQRLAQRLGERLPLPVLERLPVLAALAEATSGPELLAWALRAGPFDVYHANDLNTLPAAYWAAQLTNRPFVYDAHELYTEEAPDQHPGGRLIRLVTERAAQKAAAVITVNQLIADDLEALHGLTKKVVVIRNLTPLVPIPDIETRPLGSPGSLRLLYHGANMGLGAQLGTDDVLRALALVRRQHPRIDLRLTIRGRLPEAEGVRMRARLAELGLTEIVTLRPPVAGATALVEAAVAEGHDAGLASHPPLSKNWLYSTCSKVYEYQVAGLAVLSTDLVGNHEAARDAGLYWPAGDIEALAKLFVTLADDRALLRRLQLRARQRAQEELCWEHEQHRLTGIYARLAHNAAAPNSAADRGAAAAMPTRQG